LLGCLHLFDFVLLVASSLASIVCCVGIDDIMGIDNSQCKGRKQMHSRCTTRTGVRPSEKEGRKSWRETGRE
jgi:hypothetical protein